MKCMSVVTVFLRRAGVNVYPYLDDWLIKGWSKELVEEHVRFSWSTFRHRGLLINKRELTFIPTQRIEFIGAVLDSTRTRASLPESRFRAIETLVQNRDIAYHHGKDLFEAPRPHASCTYVV